MLFRAEAGVGGLSYSDSVFVAGAGDGARVIYSASDLAAAARCEYALLRAFDAKLGRGPTLDTVEDEMLRRTAELGGEHERRTLEDFVAKYGEGVIRLETPRYSVPALTAAAEATRAAFARSPDVVYQATMFDGRFLGFADFVIREGEGTDASYRVLDTKLARHAKVTALLQIAAYADVLKVSGLAVSPTAGLVLGNKEVVDYPVADLVPVYRQQRERLQSLLDGHLDSGQPVDWRNPTVSACMRCEFCVPHVVADDDLLLVAGMRMTQRETLMDAGIGTVAHLATSQGVVEGMASSTLTGLRTQARLQVEERESGVPKVEIADGDALGALPAMNPGDLFFDFEGDPLWTDDGITWGLEYMWGVLDAKDRFTPLWAEDRTTERKALVDFLAMVRKRRNRYPGMHVYHYAAYERTALLTLAARYGVGENEVDDLLREDVLVDLYPIVRNSLRVGAPSYSLKALEPLYMDSESRSGEVTNAASSITEYEKYRMLLDQGRVDDAEAVLKNITDYNEYDCRSTRRLRDFLLLRAFECGVTHLTKPPTEADAVPPVDDTSRVLLDFAGDGVSAQRSQDQTAAALLDAARGYYQRERKPYWWGHFQRLSHPVDEWGDTSGVFLVDGAEVVAGWHKEGRQRKFRRHTRLTGVLQGGVLGSDVQVLYDRPAPGGLDDEHPDRRAAGNAKVLETRGIDGVPVDITIEELQPAPGPFTQLPMAVTPGQPFGTKKIEDAIEALATDAAGTLGQRPSALPRNAVVDILCRRPPTTKDVAALPRLDTDIASITAALLNLDRSYLAVHGPPGTGKTYTAARVIAALVNQHGWRVGVVAQSHAVVEHLLNGIVAAGVDRSLVAKKPSNDPTAATAYEPIDSDAYAAFLDSHPACVIGGTAWDFANDTRFSPELLDLLAIDEAGQFSLAYTMAVARSTRNLLLLGDPQQLAQVSTGSHPEPVDASALGWLMEGHDVLPAEFGYFLEHSHRMHPMVCDAVSALSYDNRLFPHSDASLRALDGYAPGVRTRLVDHHGNSATSIEEAAVIADEIDALIGRAWSDGKHPLRPLNAADVLVVTPYNAQVLLLREELGKRGFGETLVGTVDKLQGREAPVVFVSMTASAVDDIPRGMPFLLNRNRLNVAVSRAQYLAVIVRSPLLTEYLPTTPDGMIDLGAFLSLSPCDRPSQ